MNSYLQNYLQQTPSFPHWSRIGIHPHHGIIVMLSSLLSKQSAGIGEFLDLCPLIDWMKEIGIDILQLLPLTDSAEDPSPYNAVSSCALNPIYLSLWDLPGVENYGHLTSQISTLQKDHPGKQIDYTNIRKKKMAFLWEYYQLFFDEIAQKEDYQQFIEENLWLVEYGLYLTLRTRFYPNPWPTWPASFSKPSQKLFSLIREEENMIDFYNLLQFLSYTQIQKVKRYAEEKGIFLMGDIPILLSRDSADCWFHQELFSFSYQAGAPPDMYNSEGQKWGFPLFKWETEYSSIEHWWVNRLKIASSIYHIYRIDHVVGFFRIWGIKKNLSPKEGAFFSDNRYLWPFHGKERLTMLLASSLMLPIAEDLGTIPPETYEILKELGICGTKVMRWERMWEENGRFVPSQDYEPMSVTSVSTHDSETLWQWWHLFPKEAEEFANSRNIPYKKDLDPSIRFALLKDAHSTSSIFHCNLLQEYLSLFPELSHKDPNLDRINVPGTPSNQNWAFCFHTTIEEIVSHSELKDAMQKLSALSPLENKLFEVKV